MMGSLVAATGGEGAGVTLGDWGLVEREGRRSQRPRILQVTCALLSTLYCVLGAITAKVKVPSQ